MWLMISSRQAKPCFRSRFKFSAKSWTSTVIYLVAWYLFWWLWTKTNFIFVTPAKWAYVVHFWKVLKLSRISLSRHAYGSNYSFKDHFWRGGSHSKRVCTFTNCWSEKAWTCDRTQTLIGLAPLECQTRYMSEDVYFCVFNRPWFTSMHSVWMSFNFANCG